MQKSFLRETAGVVMRALVVVLTIVLVIVSVSSLYEYETGISDGTCNIAVLPIEGAILPYYGLGDFDLVVTPEIIETFMATAEEDDSIDAILIEINSPGGTPVASQRIAERIKNSSLPVVGLIGDMGASGGYMVAAASDVLVASTMSNVGSIGVNMSYTENSKKNDEEGITYVQLTAGEFKDAGSPDRPITEAERAKFQADLDLVNDEFISIVAKYRDMSIEDVEKVADGATMPGSRALETGLVDYLGGRPEAIGLLASVTGQSVSDISLCEYKSGILPF